MIIDDMERLTNETEGLAVSINNTLQSGTKALINSNLHVCYYLIGRKWNLNLNSERLI